MPHSIASPKRLAAQNNTSPARARARAPARWIEPIESNNKRGTWSSNAQIYILINCNSASYFGSDVHVTAVAELAPQQQCQNTHNIFTFAITPFLYRLNTTQDTTSSCQEKFSVRFCLDSEGVCAYAYTRVTRVYICCFNIIVYTHVYTIILRTYIRTRARMYAWSYLYILMLFVRAKQRSVLHHHVSYCVDTREIMH